MSVVSERVALFKVHESDLIKKENKNDFFFCCLFIRYIQHTDFRNMSYITQLKQASELGVGLGGMWER